MAPTNLDKAVHDRDSTKSQIAMLQDELKENDINPLTEHEVTHNLAMTKTLQVELIEIHKRIIHTAPADIAPHEIACQELFRRTNKLLGSFTGLKMSFPTSSTTTSGSTSSSSSAHSTDIRLPRLELPSFDGTLQDWVPFRDMFITAVHGNTNLSKSQKLTYLKSLLRGEANRSVSSIIISDANYDMAWQQLQDRYQNDRELLFAVMRRFDNQPVVTAQSASSLRQLADISRESIRYLTVLSLPTDQWDAILLFYVIKKLDSYSKELWEQSLNNTSIPTLKSLFEFIEQRARALSASGASSRPQTRSQTSGSAKPSNKHQSYHQNAKPGRKCLFCQDQHHSIFKCQTFMGWTVQQRVEAVRKNNLCNNCLGEHSAAQCTCTKVCKTCGRKHHTLIHFTKSDSTSSSSSTNPSVEEKEPRAQTFHTIHSPPTTEEPPAFDSVLATSIVMVPDHKHQNQPCRIFIDQGSNTHYVTESFVRTLRAPRIEYFAESTGLGDEPVSSSSGYIKVTVCSRFDPSISFEIKALIVKKISSFLPLISYDPSRWSHLQGLELADPSWYKPQKIDMLLGAELFFAILKDGKKTGPSGSPIAINTDFGWIIGGGSHLSSSSGPRHQPYSTQAINICPRDQSASIQELTNQTLRKFWEIEEVPSVRLLTKEEDCQKHFSSTHSRDENGRFIVHLPFKSPCPTRGPSMKIATKRLHYLERRLQNQPTYRQEYNHFMKEYESLGHMVEVPPLEVDSNKVCYIPHHCVTKDSSTTTKFRVVFDASAKTANGVSLNDTLMVGPTVQDSLVDILIRFRLHKIAFTADIANMYRQIKVSEADTEVQRILWREDPSQPIKHFKLNTVTYGTAPAPHLAVSAVQELADIHKESLPLASAIARRDMYMDDLMSGEPSVSLALESQSQLLQLMTQAGFDLRKWSSNSQEVLDALPPESRETQSLLSLDPDAAIKTLGICWSPQTDHFRFHINSSPNSNPASKRKVLSDIAKLFDPIGWLAPVIITAKILMQSLWKEDLQWDEPLPDSFQQQWNHFQTDLKDLESLHIPRHFFTGSQIVCPSLNRSEKTPHHFSLVGFCDASEKAYAAVVYLCAYSTTGQSSLSLVTSKTRVAPAKQVSPSPGTLWCSSPS